MGDEVGLVIEIMAGGARGKKTKRKREQNSQRELDPSRSDGTGNTLNATN